MGRRLRWSPQRREPTVTEPDPEPHPTAASTKASTTGDPAVDEVLERLNELDSADVDHQVAVFDDVHAGLTQILQVGDPEQAAGDAD